jgi:small subunit ribosomal protein S20
LAHSSRNWTGARTPQALKRVRQSGRRNAILQPRRSAAKTEVKDALLAAASGDAEATREAVAAAASALDKAAKVGAIHPNNAARRKSRLMAKANAAHLLDGTEAESGPKKRSAATKTAQRKKVAAAKASKAATARAADRPRTAAGKAKVAVTRASRESAAARRRKQTKTDDEAPADS